ncbi:unnamed protein product [Symbiodinium sp. CCMP2592]|nr:unnamed protein product [Symbiodinium sp. CCMP2592]
MVFGKLNEESEFKLAKVAQRLQAVMRPNQKKARPMCRKEQKDSGEPAEPEPVPAEDDDCIMLVDDDEPELLPEEPALQEGQTEAIGPAASLVDDHDDEPDHSGQEEPSLMEGQAEAIEPLPPRAGDDNVVISDDEVEDDRVSRAAETAPEGVPEPSCTKDTAVSHPPDTEAFVIGSESEDETRPESSGQDEMVSWPGDRAEMHPNPHPFRRCDTSCSSILIDSPVKVSVAKSCDELSSALPGSCASLEGALQSLSLSPATGKTVAAASSSQTPQPNLVIDKYPAIKPPAADFLREVEQETSTADPPPYNANGQQAGKKRRRRGKQNEGGKKQKVACDEEGGDEDCDEGGEADQDGHEGKEEERQQPILQKPKAATKPPAAKKNKAKEAAKPPAQKPSSKGKAGKKSIPPVEEKDKDDCAEPIKEDKEEKQGKDGDGEPIKEKKQGKDGDGSDASIPSLEEVKAKGGFVPPDHVHGNNIYSNAYRQSLKESNDIEAAKKRGRYATAIFKQYRLVIPGMCGNFRAPRLAKRATGDAKPKGETADKSVA